MIPFVRADGLAPGRCEQMSPLIRRVVADNPGPFTYIGTGTYLVGPSRPGATVAVIDPGPDDPAHLAALLNAVRGQTVGHVLVTHAHRDHAPLAHPFARAVGAPVLAAPPAARIVHAAGPVEEGVDDGFRPDATLRDGQRLSGDGWTLEVMATPGHSSDHLAFGLEQENALFTGDHVMGWSTTVVAPPDGDMAAYMRSLDAVIARDFTTLWPTHGAPITRPGPFLAAYRAHRLAREAQILARLEAGDRTAAQVVAALYADIDRRLWPAAALSVWAHLIKLVNDGRATATPDMTLDARYRPAGD